MKLEEYFRLPACSRLSRKAIAEAIRERGHEITPEAVGLWIRSGTVPEKWQLILEEILNSAEKSKYLPRINVVAR
jgi:hypothetical protein